MKTLWNIPLAGLLVLASHAPALADNWTLALDTPAQVAAANVTVVYSGTITNTTGAPLVLNGGLDFATSPEAENFTIDFAPALLALDLVVPTGGYTGPIFTVSWNTGVAAGSFGIGNLLLSADTPAAPGVLSAPFTLGMPGLGPFCNTGTGVIARGNSVASNDSIGEPVIVYNDPNSGTLLYAVFNGSLWTTTTITSGIGNQAAPSMAMDADLHPHVAFYDATAGNLVHAWNAGGGWQSEVVESANDVGASPSLAIDAAGDLHVSYYDKTNGDLRYARRSGGVWSAGLVDATGDVGRSSSVATDENGQAFISYYDATNQDLKLASPNGVAWQTEVVDGAGARGASSAIAVHEGAISIAYRDATPADHALRLATGSPGSWSSELVDDTGQPGLGVALTLNSFGQPRVAYQDSASGEVRFATRSGPLWTIQPVSSSGSALLSLGHSGSDEPYVSYADRTSGELRFASLQTCGVTAVAPTTNGSGPLLVLHGNRPNPFHGNTTFVFALARSADVRLRVYDTAGRLVAEPFRGPAGAGTHEVRWDGSGRGGDRLAPGRYLYEVRSGGETRVGPLVLLK